MLGYVLLALAVVAVCCRGRRRMSTHHGFFLAVFLVGGAAAAVTSQTTIDFALRHGLEPFPQSTFLLGSLLSIAAAFCVLSMLSYALAERAPARRRMLRQLALLLTCGCAMTALLLSIHPAAVPDFLDADGKDPRAAAYYAVYVGYIGMAALEFLVLILRYLRSARPARQVAISLRLEIGGAVLALVWCTWGAIRAVANTGDAPGFVNLPTITNGLSQACLAVMTAGAVWFVWARKAADAWAWWAAWRLGPLWERLRPVGSQYVLQLGSDESTSTLVLFRRIVEIRDWQFQLRVHVHPQLQDWVRDVARRKALSVENAAALREAAELVSGLEARAEGIRYPAPRGTRADPARPPAAQRTEVRALQRIAVLSGTTRLPSGPLSWRDRALVRTLSRQAHAKTSGTAGVSF